MRLAGLSAAAIAAASFGMALAADTPRSLPTGGGKAAPPVERAAVVELAGDGFIDNFRELDDERWTVSDGWSNGDWTSSDWRRGQVRLTPEGLALTLDVAPRGSDKPFMSGEISTSEEFRYGYFETRMRIPRGAGLVVGAFTFTREAGNSTWNEIDMELLGRNPRRIELTFHEGGRARNRNVDLPFDASDGFHTYGFEWRRDVLRWYVDGRLVHTMRGAAVQRLTRPQRFIIHLWNSQTLDGWVGAIDRSEAPWTLVIACAAHAERYRGRSLCAEQRPPHRSR
jgi:endo-1,3-1,4-beta-glycanase ExoK